MDALYMKHVMQMVYNQTICLKAELSKEEELKSTKEILEITASDLEEVKQL